MGQRLFEIGALLASIALVALLVRNASGTVSIINAGTSGYANLLNTIIGGNSFGGSAPIGAGTIY